MSIEDTEDGLMISITCPNCQQGKGEGKFCASCGQKNDLPKLRLRSVLGDFFSVVFNFDNLFFRTLAGGLYPSRLAKTYIRGARKKYLNPFRFFFYAWLAYALVSQFDKVIDVKFDTQDDTHSSFIEDIMTPNTDTIRQEEEGVIGLLDEMFIDDTEEVDTVVDETFNIYTRSGYVISLVLDSFDLKPSTDSSKTILLSDLRKLPSDSLYQKYDVRHWRDKFALGRAKRIDKGAASIINYLKDHVIWLIFGVIPFSALWLKLLFWRSKRFYVEHVLYLLYLYAMFFEFLVLLHLVNKLPSAMSFVSVLVVIGIMLYSYFSMKYFYEKGYVKTFFTWLLYLLGNSFIYIIIAAIYLVVSIAIF